MSGFSDLGKLIVLAGAVLVLLGGLLWLVSRVPLLGHLPGDIRIQWRTFSCFFPLTTMLLLSVLLTVILNIILRLMRK